MPKRKVRIGVIGCGRIAQKIHLKHLKNNPRVELAAAVDIKDKNLKAACGKFGIARGYLSAEEMFDAARPDAVLICTPNWAHRELTVMAAERGIHVFCEKPMAVNASECKKMMAACNRAGVHFQLGMCKRFDAGIVKAKKMILSGRLGNVSQITTSFLNPPMRLDSLMVSTVKKLGEAAGVDMEEQWGLWAMTDPRTGGGMMMEMGTHLLDFILFLAGEEPSRHSGFVNRKRTDMLWEDQGSLLVKFPSGLIGSVEINMSATADNIIGENGRIYGDKASLAFALINGEHFGLPFYHHIHTILMFYGPLSPFTGMAVPLPVKTGKRVQMYKLQMDYFVDRILGRDTDYFGLGPDFAAGGRDGLAVMRVIDAAYAASGALPSSRERLPFS